MMRTIDRGKLVLSPRRKWPTSCGLPSSLIAKSLALRPCTVRPWVSTTSRSEATSEVSIRTTSSALGFRFGSPSSLSAVSFFCGSHLSFLRLEPKSLSFGFSRLGDWAKEPRHRATPNPTSSAKRRGTLVHIAHPQITPITPIPRKRFSSNCENLRILIVKPEYYLTLIFAPPLLTNLRNLCNRWILFPLN